jgi:hypothetical protein
MNNRSRLASLIHVKIHSPMSVLVHSAFICTAPLLLRGQGASNAKEQSYGEEEEQKEQIEGHVSPV